MCVAGCDRGQYRSLYSSSCGILMVSFPPWNPPATEPSGRLVFRSQSSDQMKLAQDVAVKVRKSRFLIKRPIESSSEPLFPRVSLSVNDLLPPLNPICEV